MRDGPCYQCERRHAGCHAECGQYLDWRREWDANRAEIVRENEKKAGLDALLVKKALDNQKKWRSK